MKLSKRTVIHIGLYPGYHLQSRPKVVGTLELDHVSPIPLINVGKYRVFSNKKVKNHPSINIESGGRGELACCPNLFVRDCRFFLVHGRPKYFTLLAQVVKPQEKPQKVFLCRRHDWHENCTRKTSGTQGNKLTPTANVHDLRQL